MTTAPLVIDAGTFFPARESLPKSVDFSSWRPELFDAAQAYLDHYMDAIQVRHRQGAGGREVVGELTRMFDILVQTLFEAATIDLSPAGFGACTLIALGGYGRGEINPRSDLDIMFFYGGRDREFAEKISERILYLLWDLGLDVGHSIRTASDCLEHADRDLTVRTALIDSRFLAGDSALYARYEKEVLATVLSKNTQTFIRNKLEENNKRREKYGSSVYLLEPNIKEGEGGLRDLHTAVWIAQVKYKAKNLKDMVIKGVITESEWRAFEDAYDYLWRIRNELHFISTRKSDQMHFDQQERIARFLGYKNNRRALAVEQFMQDYYYRATEIEHLSSSLIARIQQLDKPVSRLFGASRRRQLDPCFYILKEQLRVRGEEVFQQDPSKMMRAFMLSQYHQVPLSLSLKGLIRDNLHLINDKVRRTRIINELFLDILRSRRGVSEVLREMHHLQFLNCFIPEFGRIFCKVQHDLYHTYTVDTHSIFAVEEVLKLRSGEYGEEHPILTRIANDIEKPELLLLAVLLHDIGKGEGKDHSNKGAAMMPTIARRMGLNREDSRRLEFLVRHHLTMAHISQRRDLHDDHMIVQFARTMEMSENLKMLYLLTFADLKAVGPDVWSDWKGMLLQELYDKTYQVLEKGNFAFEKRSEKLRNRRRAVVRALADELGEKTVKEDLKTMSTRYQMAYDSAEIAEHLRLVHRRGKKTLALKLEHDYQRGFTEVSITTLDVPGLFSMITGVMAANGINILGAQIHTRKNGEVLDILQVNSSAEDVIDDPEKWRKVEQDLVMVIEGRGDVEQLVVRRQPPAFMIDKPRPRFPTKVEIDNNVSPEYTVIDIFAHNKVGLLYSITRTLKDLGLYIGVSKISTKVDQAADVFYVQDIFGQKVLQEEKIEEIKTHLLQSLEREI
ncbi:MAG: [protein-PII] uridylyltransferase [Thermodesulfobacteriota bacterium]|jgi:[protein-PII] uridylyltransferase|nr:[protein-PII] uridylyltransferase [Thermodesulfobacteriota bacterium]